MSLPEDIIINVLARVPRCHYPTLSLVSKHFRSLIASPDIYAIRSLLGCTEHFLYVVLRNRDNNDRRLYTLCRKTNGKNSRLVLIPCLPALPRRASFVAVGSKIYVFGGSYDKNNKMTSTAYSIDCRSHTVQPLPSMPHVFKYQTMADVIDDRLYVVGFINKERIPVVVVFNTRTQMWEPGMTNLDVPAGSFRRSYGCMVMDNKIYSKKFVYDPKKAKWETHDKMLNWKKLFKHACVINDVMYYYSCVKNKLKAYDSKKKSWNAVKGLNMLLGETRGTEAWLKTVRYNGKVAFLFPTQEPFGVGREICCAAVSLERRKRGKIIGKVEWFNRLIAGNFEIIQALDVML